MPNWKKLIVSGSEATLNSLTVTTTGSFYDDLTISGSNSSLILKSDGNKFARLTHNGDGLVIDGSVQNQYISIGSPTWNWPNGVRVYGDLQQSGSAGSTATFEGPTQATVNLKTTTGNKNNYIVGTSTGDISFRPAGTESVVLKSVGKVGIGTNNPRTKLEIGGSGTLGAVTNKVISATFDGGFSTTNSLQYNVNAFIGTTFGTTDIFASTSSETNKNFYTGLVSDNSYFNASRYSVVQGGAERLTVAVGGNVGIKTATPQALLQIGTRGTAGALTPPATNGILFDFHNDGNPYTRHAAIISQASDATESVIDFWTKVHSGSSAKKMTIRGNGNVGIGTDNPGGLFQVNKYTVASQGNQGTFGNISSFANSNVDNIFLGLKNGAYPNRGYAFRTVAAGVNSDFTIFEHGQGTGEVFRIKANGNVGIGTTNPSTKLEISSSGVNGIDISQSASNATQSGRLFFSTNTASEGFALFNSNGTLQINSGGIPNNTSGTNRISIIGSSGNVGIGTTSPGSKLQVDGDITTSGNIILSGASNEIIKSDGSIRLNIDSNNDQTNRVFIVSTGANSELFKVDESGNGTFAGELTANDDINASTKIVIGESSAAELRLKKTNAGVAKVTFWSDNSEKGYLELDASEDMVYYASSSIKQIFYSNAQTTLTLDSQNATFAGSITMPEALKATGNNLKFFAGGTHVFNVDVNRNIYPNTHNSTDLGFSPTLAFRQLYLSGNISSTAGASFGGNVFLPDNKYSIYGGASNAWELQIGVVGDNAFIEKTATTNGDLYIKNNGSGKGIIFQNGNATALTIDSSQNATFTGDVVVAGTLTAQEFKTELVSSSIVYESGSTKFGDSSDDIHSFSGSLRVTGSGVHYFTNGNVGIGTTAPSTTLQLSKANTEVLANQPAWPAGILEITDTSAYDAGTGATIVFRKRRDAVGNEVTVGAIAGEGIGGDSKLSFWTGTAAYMGTAPKMVIRDNGNVGIGTTSPSKKLDVAGSFKLGTNAYIEYGGVYPYTISTLNTAAIGNLVFNAGAGSSGYESKIELQGANNAASASITLTAGSTAAMVVKVDGSIKIGQYGSGTVSGSLAKSLGVDSSGNIIEFSGGSGGTVSSITSAADTRIAFFNGSDSLEGSANFTWDDTKLQVNGGISVGAGSTRSQISGPTSGNANMTFAANAGNVNTATSEFIFTNSLNGSNTRVERMRINSTGQVGIGETNIDARLHISALSSSGLSNVKLESPGSSKWAFGIPANQTYFALDDVNDNLTTSKLVVLKTSGNVGIGTTSPTKQLHLKRTTGDVRGIMVETSVATSYAEIQVKAAREFRIGTGGSSTTPNGQFYVYDATAGAHRFDINAAGNVGIGTISPGYKLHVNGNAYINSTLYANGQATFDDQVNVTSGYSINFGTSRLHSTSTSYLLGGNVGIGTTSPTALLEVKTVNATVYDSTSDSGQDSGTATVLVSNDNQTNNTFSQIAFHNKGSNRGISRIVSIGVANASTDLAFVTENSNTKSEKMRILANGNVGIGTNAPSQKLHVHATSGDGLLRVSGDNIATSGGEIKGFNNGFAFNVAPSGGGTYVERMRINGAGSVGIGTHTPFTTGGVTKLALYSTTNLLSMGLSNSDMSYIRRQGTGEFQWQTYKGSNDGELQLQPYGGKVGIGTTSPSHKFHVNGDAKATTYYGQNIALTQAAAASGVQHAFYSLHTSNNTIRVSQYGQSHSASPAVNQIGVSNAEQHLHLVTDSNTNILAGTSTKGIFLRSGGNVGIGTRSPGYKFDVAGDIQNNGVFRKGGNVIIKSTGSETRIGPGGSGIVTFHNSATMTAGDETVRIDASGNLMLNNTSAGARLDIREDSGYAIRAENASGHYFRVNSGGDTEIAGDLTVAGILTAQEFHTELVSASIVYESGSTKFGNTSDDIHDFTGSLKVLGSVNSTSAGISNFERLHINSLQSWSAQDLGSASSGSVAFRINGRSGATNDFIISTAQGTVNYTMQVVGNATTSGQLHINPFGGNVGIGTNSAGEKLSVAGNAEIYSGTTSGYLNVGRNAQERITLQVNDNTNTINATNDSDGNGAHNFVLDRNFAGTGANNFLISKAGSTQMLIDTNGNVGIGATPRTIGTYKVLDISGTAGGYIGLSSGSTQQGELYSHSGGVDLVTIGAKYTRFYNNGGEKMRIHSSGNVGIGNTLDLNKLDVSGNINLHGGNGGNLTFNNGDANITVNYNNANSVVGRDLSFKTYKAGVGNTEKMRITRDGDIGFGTTVVTSPGLWYDATNKYLAISHWATPPTPAALLHISDNANNVDVPQIRIEGRENPGDTKLDISVRDPQVRFNLIENSVDSNNGYGLMTFKTNAIPNAAVNRGGFNFEVGATGGGVVQALTITNQSNVGIGTPTPQKKLHIEGPGGASASQVLVTGASDTIGSTAGILLRAESGEGDSALRAKGGIFFERTAANGLGKLHFANNGSNNNDSATLANSRMTILNNGNVGIGTTSPTNKLTVDDTIGIKRSGVAAITTLQQTGTGLILNAPSGYHPLVIKYNGSEKARFNNSGALHVVGDISGSGQLFVNTGTDTGDILQVKGNNNVFAARLDGGTTGGQSYGLRVRAGTNSVDAGLLIENTSGTDLFKVTGEGHVQIVSANISYHQNTDVDSSAAEVIATVSTGSYTGAFFDYTCVSGSNARIGTVMAVNVAGSVEFTDNSSDSIGVTSGVVLTVDISGGNMRLKAATTTNNWNIKTLVRSL